MNPRWLLVRRLRGPAFLLTFGVTALLHQWDVLSFGQSWPLYLIVAGVLTLLERAALTAVPLVPYPGEPYPGGPYTQGPYATGPYAGYPNPGQPYPPPQGWGPNPQSGTGASPATSTSIVPSGPADITPEGRR